MFGVAPYVGSWRIGSGQSLVEVFWGGGDGDGDGRSVADSGRVVDVGSGRQSGLFEGAGVSVCHQARPVFA